ncbi:SCO2400 family protein, partial [Streptomyces prunicolor]|uniref:SCO2400 family protein n=1 Tax=Streptomyces prunicolor TaxID=67348 RepID=UPI0034713826
MDYCHPCGRHLNGALACPGCGASAEAPVESTQAHARAVDARPQPDAPDAGRDEDAENGEPQGRAARRKSRGRGRVGSHSGSGDFDDDGDDAIEGAGLGLLLARGGLHGEVGVQFIRSPGLVDASEGIGSPFYTSKDGKYYFYV